LPFIIELIQRLIIDKTEPERINDAWSDKYRFRAPWDVSQFNTMLTGFHGIKILLMGECRIPAAVQNEQNVLIFSIVEKYECRLARLRLKARTAYQEEHKKWNDFAHQRSHEL
jgi:hypothetical protein